MPGLQTKGGRMDPGIEVTAAAIVVVLAVLLLGFLLLGHGQR